MRKLILGATVALLLAGCGNDSTDINDFYVFIPDSSDLVVQINDADLFQNAAANNPLISNLTTSEIAENIKKHIPDFQISYAPDSRQQIADSWPSSIDDSVAQKDWGWKAEFDLDRTTKEMLENLSK